MRICRTLGRLPAAMVHRSIPFSTFSVRCSLLKADKEVSNRSIFDAIQDTEAFVAANDESIMVVFRGTQEITDWATNLDFFPRRVPDDWELVGEGCEVHEVNFIRISPEPERRSTIEVHLNFSKAPHLRSSVPLLKTDFSKNQVASRRVIPWPEPTKRFVSNSRLTFRLFWGHGTPSFRNKIAKMCYLNRRTGPSGPES